MLHLHGALEKLVLRAVRAVRGRRRVYSKGPRGQPRQPPIRPSIIVQSRGRPEPRRGVTEAARDREFRPEAFQTGLAIRCKLGVEVRRLRFQTRMVRPGSRSAYSDPNSTASKFSCSSE